MLATDNGRHSLSYAPLQTYSSPGGFQGKEREAEHCYHSDAFEGGWFLRLDVHRVTARCMS